MAGLISLLRKGAKEIEEKLSFLRIEIVDAIDIQGETSIGYNIPLALECQFFPEEFTDNREVNFITKTPLKASRPVYGWLMGTERTISFSIVLIQEVKNYQFISPKKFSRTVDIRYVIRWLRRLIYPAVLPNKETIYPPPLLRLYIPNLQIGYEDNPNMLYVFMTGCDVEYEDLYPDNTPRIAVVNVSFVESIWDENLNVNFRDRYKDFKKIVKHLPPLKEV